jgi:hypothetical protein
VGGEVAAPVPIKAGMDRGGQVRWPSGRYEGREICFLICSSQFLRRNTVRKNDSRSGSSQEV